VELLGRIDEFLLLGFGVGISEVLLALCFKALGAGLHRLKVCHLLAAVFREGFSSVRPSYAKPEEPWASTETND